MQSRLIVTFLPRSKSLLISWLWSPSAVILEPKKIKSVTVSIVSPSICHEMMRLDAMIFVFWLFSLSQLFHASLSLSSRGSLVSLCFLPYGWYHLHIWCYWYISWESWFQLVIHLAQCFSWHAMHLVKLAGWQYTALIYSFPNLEPVHCSNTISNCCFLMFIQIT